MLGSSAQLPLLSSVLTFMRRFLPFHLLAIALYGFFTVPAGAAPSVQKSAAASPTGPITMQCPNNGSQDATACVQQTINRMVATNKSGAIVCPDGRYPIRDTLLFDGWPAQNPPFSFGGDTNSSTNVGGTGGCQFIWRGEPGKPMFRLRGTKFVHLHDFSVTADRPIDVVVQLETKAGHTIREGRFSRIRMEGRSNGHIAKCFRTVDGDTGGMRLKPGGRGPDANNDLHHFEDIECTNYKTAALSFEHSQSKWHLIENLHCGGNERHFLKFDWSKGDEKTAGPYCVTTSLAKGGGQPGNGGSFRIVHGVAFRNIIDFWIMNPNDVTTISGVLAENSGRFARIGPKGYSGVGFTVNIHGNRVHADRNHIPPQGEIIWLGTKGPFNIWGNEFNSHTESQMKIKVHTADAVVHLWGNEFPKAGSVETSPVAGSDKRVHRWGNVYRDAQGKKSRMRADEMNMGFGMGEKGQCLKSNGDEKASWGPC